MEFELVDAGEKVVVLDIFRPGFAGLSTRVPNW
jgi:hypothetical protein